MTAVGLSLDDSLIKDARVGSRSVTEATVCIMTVWTRGKSLLVEHRPQSTVHHPALSSASASILKYAGHIFVAPLSHVLSGFYARQLYRQVLLRARISYGNSVRLSVRLSVCLSRPGTDSMPGEIETPGLHHMIA